MTNHPRQREMWEGLTAWGCLGLITILVVMSILAEVYLG